MRFSVATSALCLVSAVSTLAAPAPIPEETKPSPDPAEHLSGGEEYVVIFDVDKPTPPGVQSVLETLNLTSEHSDVKYTFENNAFRGFVASMKDHCLELLDQNIDVSTVEKTVQISSLDTRSASPWGLERISSTGAMSGNVQDTSFTYTFQGSDGTAGQGVDIYVVDTGVNIAHQVFGGRAIQGFSFQTDTSDGDGHGTHVAGTAAGAYFGVASGANVYAIKVLGADGSGTSADTIKGMDWVIDNHNQRKTQPGFVGSIMSMSWGLGGHSLAVQTAITTAAGEGIHVSVAAGNAGKDSCASSPSDVGGANGPAITVGSIGIESGISQFSNTGTCNDVYGPGENILSAWNTQTNMVNFLSGTSMACPHVTGVMAYLMVEHPELAQDPAAMKSYLNQNGIPNFITGKANGNDPKVLVNNGERAASSKRKRMIHIRNEGSVLSVASNWVRRIISIAKREQVQEFVLRRALPDGVQLRY